MSDPMKLLITIVERGQGARMVQFYHSDSCQLRCLWQFSGRGTASSEVLDMLGIGTAERDILLTLATRRSADRLLRRLKSTLGGNIHARGILFSLPLSAVSGLMAAALDHLEHFEETEDPLMNHDTPHSLILILVNQGYTDTVMATAKAAGARGGTILRARWAGDNQVHDVMGITVQEEKELLAIVSSPRDRKAIMEAIHEKHGLRAPSQAVLCSLPIEDLVRLG